jgi:peptidyl-dipeptidase Dcp
MYIYQFNLESCHFAPAIYESMNSYLEELQSIVDNPDNTFATTIETFDRCGGSFNNVMKIYENLGSSNCIESLQEVQKELAGPIAKFTTKIYTFPGLFARIDEIYNNRNNLNLNFEETRVLERFHLDFVRAG